MWILNMEWRDLLFAHWPVDPRLIAPWIPAPLELDTFDGAAWVGVVPFHMSSVGPFRQAFPELNVRTYARFGDRAGVWFFTLDAASKLAVRTARRFFHLNYCDAEMSVAETAEGGFRYRSRRTHRGMTPATLDVTYRPVSDIHEAAEGSLDHWLTERYSLFSADAAGRVYLGDVEHVRWPLQAATAEWHQLDMTQGLGFTLDGPPARLAFARYLRTRASMLRRIC